MPILAHIGKPCEPPIVEGVTFEHLEDGVWLGEATDEQAEILIRLPGVSVYGGSSKKAKKSAPADPAPDADGGEEKAEKPAKKK